MRSIGRARTRSSPSSATRSLRSVSGVPLARLSGARSGCGLTAAGAIAERSGDPIGAMTAVSLRRRRVQSASFERRRQRGTSLPLGRHDPPDASTGPTRSKYKRGRSLNPSRSCQKRTTVRFASGVTTSGGAPLSAPTDQAPDRPGLFVPPAPSLNRPIEWLLWRSPTGCFGSIAPASGRFHEGAVKSLFVPICGN